MVGGKLGASAILLLVLIALYVAVIPVAAQQPSLSYVYKLRGDGSASVTIVITGLTGLVEYSFPISEEVVNDSLVAFNEQGDIVLATYNGTHIIVYPMNATDKVIVQYEAIIGEVIDGYVRINITVLGPATIVLPEGAGLIYFSGSPSVEIVGETIKLRYNVSGTIQLEYILAETETITTPTTTETTTITTTTTETITTTPTPTTETTTTTTTPTTSPTPITTPTTTTPTKSVIVTTPTSTYTTTPTSTQQSPTESPTTSTTSTQPTTTPTTTTPIIASTPATSETTVTTETTQAPSPIPFATVAVFIVIIIVLLVAGIFLYKAKFSKTYFSSGTGLSQGPSSPPSPPPSGGEVVLMEHRGIDERDRLILSKLSEKPMSISELSRELGLSKSTVWRRIRKLEKEGYVITHEEGKKTIIKLTDKARSLLGY